MSFSVLSSFSFLFPSFLVMKQKEDDDEGVFCIALIRFVFVPFVTTATFSRRVRVLVR